jgi:phosphatidylglycerol:prolipoprotein diacylglycerol transferase
MIQTLIAFPDWLRPELVTIGPFEIGGRTIAFPIRWYALAYIGGLLLGWRYIVGMIREQRLWAPKSAARAAAGAPSMTVGQIDDFFVWAVLGVILGGRVGYVLFYMLPDDPSVLWTDPLQIVMVWQGGMSFHGGLLGVTLAILLFARGQKIPPLRIADLLAPAVPIGLFLGRLANFVNAELWGRVTDAPWGVVFCADHLRSQVTGECVAGELPRHPSQLYEAAMEGVVLFILLLIAVRMYKSLTRPGFNTGLFLAGYGVARFLLEFVREPDAHMPEFPLGLTMGMILSLPMVFAGAALMAYALRKPPVFARADAESAPAAA